MKSNVKQTGRPTPGIPAWLYGFSAKQTRALTGSQRLMPPRRLPWSWCKSPQWPVHAVRQAPQKYSAKFAAIPGPLEPLQADTTGVQGMLRNSMAERIGVLTSNIGCLRLFSSKPIACPETHKTETSVSAYVRKYVCASFLCDWHNLHLDARTVGRLLHAYLRARPRDRFCDGEGAPPIRMIKHGHTKAMTL